MKNNRGITLASLVIIIASILLLSTMALSFGYKYLTEAKKTDENYFKEVLSSAVSKRENNHTVNSIEYPRIGSQVTSLDSFQELLNKYVPEVKDNSEILFDRGLWYIVDNKAAEKLGVEKSSNYIGVLDEELEDDVVVALVDYYSGAVFLLKVKDASDLEDYSDSTANPITPDETHTHNFNIANPTCTLDKKCLICGYVEATALGHKYGDTGLCEQIDDEFHYTKICQREGCEMKGGYERHTDLDVWTFYQGEDGKWYHFNGCSKCGWPQENIEYKDCQISWKSISDTNHIKVCSICKHQQTFAHEFYYEYVNENYHDVYCSICNYKKRVPHNGTPCTDCNYNPSDSGVILEIVELKNKEWPDSKFVTDGETIQLIITADEPISDVDAKICGYGGDLVSKTYSNNNKTCIIELFLDSDINLGQNSKVTFTVVCKSAETGLWMNTPVIATTDSNSHLTYDSIPPVIEYLFKEIEYR